MYVLGKSLLKFEGLRPDAKVAGLVRGCKVYSRSDVAKLRGASRWKQDGLKVRSYLFFFILFLFEKLLLFFFNIAPSLKQWRGGVLSTRWLEQYSAAGGRGGAFDQVVLTRDV